MDCPYISELSLGEFGQRLRERMAGRRIPIKGSMELTFRCNLRCVHCYLSHGHQGIPGLTELSYGEICAILDQLVDEGCLWLLLTGGEPLVRRDFLDIYAYAKRKGLLITLFTNGTLLTPEIADYLAEWPPRQVEISLYGRTQETYERITGIPGSYARCRRGIGLLLERDIRLSLKTVLLTLNQHELSDIGAYAKSLGVSFRYDPMINAGINGPHDPVAYRLTPKDIVRFDLADAERAEEWQTFCERFVRERGDHRYLYVCGAGLHAFHIDPYGKLSLCLMSREPDYDLRQGTFHEGWYEFLSQVRYQEPGESYQCNRCELLSLCGQCPGWARLEHSDPERPVEFLCQVAHRRAEAFGLIK